MAHLIVAELDGVEWVATIGYVEVRNNVALLLDRKLAELNSLAL